MDIWWNTSLSCLSDIFLGQISLLSPVHLLTACHDKHFWVTKQRVHSNKRGTASWILTRQQYQSKNSSQSPTFHSPSPTPHCLPISAPIILCIVCCSHRSGRRQTEAKKSKPSMSDWREETNIMGKNIMPGRHCQVRMPGKNIMPNSGCHCPWFNEIECDMRLILPRRRWSKHGVLGVKALGLSKTPWSFVLRLWQKLLSIQPISSFVKWGDIWC